MRKVLAATLLALFAFSGICLAHELDQYSPPRDAVEGTSTCDNHGEENPGQ